MKRFGRALRKLDKAATYAENAVLMAILIAMILLAGAQIFLRNLFDTGLFWGDELLRLMVLWLTLAGALAASRMDRHISIEVLERFLSGRVELFAKVTIDLFTASVCGLFAWHSARFVMDSYAFGDVLMRDTPAWLLQLPLPVGFALIAHRHLVLAVERVSKRSALASGPVAGGSAGP